MGIDQDNFSQFVSIAIHTQLQFPPVADSLKNNFRQRLQDIQEYGLTSADNSRNTML
jgi:hypothetical protein